LILLTVFELLPKTCNFTICSIFSNSGHVGWCTASPDTILKLDYPSDDSDQVWFPLVLYFQRRRFLNKFTTYDGRWTDNDDGRQVMAIAHMTLWVRWAKNNYTRINTQQYKDQNTTILGSKHNNTRIKTQQY
jgi:hypothetical protein